MSLEDVFDILWDILLSFYVIRCALHYSALTFIGSLPLTWSSLVLSYIALDLTQRQTEVMTLLYFTNITLVCARHTMRLYKVPYRTSYRLSIGLVGAVFLLTWELAAWTTLYKWAGIWRECIILDGFGIMTAAFALMPCFLMLAGGDAEPVALDETPDVAVEQSKKD